ncbi:MAG: primase-helicase zinc-binding domain-containing protein, partial [Thiohalocapsa sp.]
MKDNKTCRDCGEQFPPPRKFPDATRCRECYERAKPRLEAERAERKRRLESVKRAALHRWPDTLAAFGINRDLLTPKHGPCPGCGGTDRFRFDNEDGRGTWICGRGGGEEIAGDGFALLAHCKGIGNSEAFMRVAEHFGLEETDSQPPPPAPKPQPTQQKVSTTQAYAIDIWARVNRDDDVVGAHPYAEAKGITWAAGAGRARVSGRLIG